MTSPGSSQPASPAVRPLSPPSPGASSSSLLRRHGWQGKAAAAAGVAGVPTPADTTPAPGDDRLWTEEAPRSRERQRRLHGDRYQGFVLEEDERPASLELGVGERLQQVPEVGQEVRVKLLALFWLWQSSVACQCTL